MNNESRPHVKPGPIKYTKGYGRKVFVSKVINFIIVLIAFVAILLTIFVYFNQPVRTENGFVQAELIYKRTPVIGEQIVVVETNNFNMFTPLKRALFIQDVYKAEIIAPYEKLNNLMKIVELNNYAMGTEKKRQIPRQVERTTK